MKAISAMRVLAWVVVMAAVAMVDHALAVEGKAYVSTLGGKKLLIVDLETNAITKTIEMFAGSCSDPYINDMEIIGTKLFLGVPGCGYSEQNQVTVVDLATEEVVNTIATGRIPTGMKEYGGKLYVVCRYAGKIQEIDPVSESITREITWATPPANAPLYLEIVNGKMYLACPGSGGTAGEIQVIDLTSGSLIRRISYSTVDTYGPAQITHVGGNKLYLGSYYQTGIFDLSTETLTGSIAINDAKSYVAMDGKVYAPTGMSTVAVVDLAANAVTKTIDVGAHPGSYHGSVGAAVLENMVCVTDSGQGVRIVDTATDTLSHTIASSELVSAIEVQGVQAAFGRAYTSTLGGKKVMVANLDSSSFTKTIDMFTESCSEPYINDLEIIGGKLFAGVPGCAYSER